MGMCKRLQRLPRFLAPLLSATIVSSIALSENASHRDAELTAKPSWYEPLLLGTEVGIPDVASFQVGWTFNPRWRLLVFYSPKVSFETSYQLDGGTYNAGLFRTITEEKSIDVGVAVGPQFGVDVEFRPKASAWFVRAGLSMREVDVTFDDGIPLRLCLITDPACTDGGLSTMQLKGTLHSQTMIGRLAAGYAWQLNKGWELSATLLGVAVPSGTARSHQLSASIDPNTEFPDWLNSVMEALLDSNIKEYEDDIANYIYEEHIAKYDDNALPMLSIGIRYIPF